MDTDWQDPDEATPRPPQQGKAWLITFTDLVSLVLTFFVLLFSMSSVKVDEWDNMIDALSRTLNPEKVAPVISPSAEFNIGSLFRKRAVDLDYLAGVLEETVSAEAGLAKTRIIRLEDRMIIALSGDLLFATGRAVLSDEARQALFDLGGLLRNVDNELVVNGHSDPVPPSGGRYATNWELSLARSIAVANTLRRSGYTQDIVAHGYADSRFAELPDLPEAERRALARRVDVVVLPTVSGAR